MHATCTGCFQYLTYIKLTLTFLRTQRKGFRAVKPARQTLPLPVTWLPHPAVPSKYLQRTLISGVALPPNPPSLPNIPFPVIVLEGVTPRKRLITAELLSSSRDISSYTVCGVTLKITRYLCDVTLKITRLFSQIQDIALITSKRIHRDQTLLFCTEEDIPRNAIRLIKLWSQGFVTVSIMSKYVWYL